MFFSVAKKEGFLLKLTSHKAAFEIENDKGWITSKLSLLFVIWAKALCVWDALMANYGNENKPEQVSTEQTDKSYFVENCKHEISRV